MSPDRRVEVHGGLPGVVSQDHGPATEEIELGVDSPAVKVVGKTCEGGLELASAEKRGVHARARS